MKISTGFESLSDLMKNKKTVKPPAYEWQDLALKIIRELRVPAFKRNSVFKVCKENSKAFVERCLIDTRELCESGEQWKYFFKLAGGRTSGGPSKFKVHDQMADAERRFVG